MSLIDQIAQNGKNTLKMTDASSVGSKSKSNMIKTTDFMSIVREVYDSSVIDKKSKKEFKGFRTRLRKAEWPLEGIMSKLDKNAWTEICQDTIKYMVKNIRNSQPNGEWTLLDYEADIRPNNNNQEAIIVACQFVDTANSTDLRYANGVPAMDVNVNVADNNAELIEALSKKTEDSDDKELKDLMKQFIQVMASDIVSKKTQEQAKTKPQPKEDSIDELAEDFQS